MSALSLITIIKGENTLKPFIIQSAIIIMSLIFLSDFALAKTSPTAIVTTKSNQTTSSHNWTGIYGGINVGGLSNRADLRAHHLGFTNPDVVCNKNLRFSSVFPGLQVGYTEQFDAKIVLGVEGDVTYNIKKQGRATCTCPTDVDVFDHFVIKNRLQGSLGARIGYALDSHLFPFLLAGVSLADLRSTYSNEGGDYYFKNTTRPGWLYGVGLEWGYSHDWSIRAEYSYVVYGNAVKMAITDVYGLSDSSGGAQVNLNTNNIKMALNYWF